MDDDARLQQGRTRRREVLGEDWVNRSASSRTDFNAEFQDFVTRYAWGDLWMRPHFDARTRRILVIGTLLALNKWEEFDLHVRTALTEGALTPDDVKEIILQQAVYCGVPAANHAFRAATKIVNDVQQAQAR